MSEAAIAEPKTQCLACGTFQNVEPATLCDHCLAKATVLLKQGHTPAQIALGRDDIRVVLEGWQESREKSIMPKTTNKPKKAVSRETPETTLAIAEETKEPRSIAILIPIDVVEANPYQPRKIFSEKEMQELVDSIKEHGVLQPILVRPNPADETRYQLIAGERRWRASREAGLTQIEAVVRQNVSDQVMAEMAIIENVQRHDMSVIEQAVALRRLITEFNLTADYLAQRIGLSRSVVSNRLRLLDLPPEVQDRIAAGQLSESHGRALVKYRKVPDFVSFYAGHIVEKQLTSKLVESGLHFRPEWQESNDFANDLEERGLLVTLETSAYYAYAKDDELLFEYPDSIFKGSFAEDEESLICLDIELANTLHQQWEQRAEEECKAAQAAGTSNSTSTETFDANNELDKKLANALAKAKSGEIVLLKDLHFSQYRQIYDHSCPKACSSQCECRARAKYDEESTRFTDICLNRNRLEKLQRDETKAKNKVRREMLGKLSDAVSLALNDSDADTFVIDEAALPLMALPIFQGMNKKSVEAALKNFDHINFDFEKFSKYDTSRATRLDMLACIPSLARFVIEVLIRDELRQAADYENAKPDCTNWLLGVLGGNDAD